MKCRHCGEELLDDSLYCSACGKSVNQDPVYTNDGHVYESGHTYEQENRQYESNNNNNLLLDILAYIAALCSPIIGFIIYFFNRKTNPKRAKICAIIAAVSYITALMFQIMFW